MWTDTVLAMTRQETAVNASSDLKLGFGIGYVEENVSGSGINVSQTVHAPFGADPVLVNTVSLTNTRSANVTIRWTDVWPGRTVLMNQGHGTPNYVRRAKAGVLGPDGAYAIVAKADPVNTSSAPSVAPSYPIAAARWQDAAPLPLFLAALPSLSDCSSGASAVTGFTTSAAELWAAPHSVHHPNPKLSKGSDISSWDQHKMGVFAIERTVHLRPGETVELRSIFGYEPEGFTATDLVGKYSTDATSLEQTVEQWERTAPSLKVPGDEGVWIQREIRWHAYMNRAGLTRLDEDWGEFMLNQEGSYIWNGLEGGEGNARDLNGSRETHSVP